MFNKFIQIFKIPDLRNKILFIIGIFVVFRIMASIPMPGVDVGRMSEFLAGQQLFGFLDLFTGGALERFSIVMLGLGPYITAVIIMQLLTMIFPALKAMHKEEGEAGRQKFNQYGRLLTVPFAALQSFGMLTFFQQQQIIAPLSPLVLFSSILTITAACLFLMWLGELITEKGLGNGISLLIFAGIIAMTPMLIRELLVGWDLARVHIYLLFLGIALLVIAAVVLINEGRRNIPVSYAKRIRGMKMYGGTSTYLPLSINPTGVMPIILAMSIILFPGIIAGFFVGVEGIIGVIAKTITNLFENPWIYSSLFFILIVFFTYFYTAITFEPKTIATNLQKMGGFIPGVRPGQPTVDFIYFILNRVLLVGAIFLGVVAILPSIIAGVTGIGVFEFLIGGTAVLIIVSVVLETMRQIRAQLQMREYETF
jgi:preprotein translocase subunit SecY